MVKNIGRNVSRTLSGKFSHKLLDHVKQSATDVLKTTSKRIIQKTAEPTGDLIDIETANKIAKVSKTSKQNNSDTVTYEYDKEIHKETNVSLEERLKVIDYLRLIQQYNNRMSKKKKFVRQYTKPTN